MSTKRPVLEGNAVYAAARVFTLVAGPAVTPLVVYLTLGSEIPSEAYLFTVTAGVVLGFLLAPVVGRIVAYLPWLPAQALNYLALLPYRALRLARRTAPTFRHSTERLSHRKVELSKQLTGMYRAKHQVQKTLGFRGPEDVRSKRRLAAADEALDAGILARQDAMEAVDALQYEVDCQRFECEIAAIRLLAFANTETAAVSLARLAAVRRNLASLLQQVNMIGDASRRARVSNALQSTEAKLREAIEHVQAIEDQGLLLHAAGLLNQVEPVAEQLAQLPSAASFDTPDLGAQLLRIEGAVSECVNQKLRLHAEMAAVDDVDALCEAEAEAEEGRLAGRGRS